MPNDDFHAQQPDPDRFLGKAPPDVTPGRLAHKPGEAGKCSMHPLLDLLSTSCLPDLSQLGNTYKAIAFTMMWELALKLFKDNQVGGMYYIASPMAQQFFSRMGLRSIHCEAAVPSLAQETQRLREEWWRYFKPSDLPENQPQVYYCSLEQQKETDGGGAC